MGAQGPISILSPVDSFDTGFGILLAFIRDIDAHGVRMYAVSGLADNNLDDLAVLSEICLLYTSDAADE